MNSSIKTSENEEYQYLNLLRKVAMEGVQKPNRTKNNTRSIFGNMMKFTLTKNNKKILPLLTTKNMLKSSELIFKELEFFIKGQTDSKILDKQGVKIWNANSSREFLDNLGFKERDVGDIGPCFRAGTKILTETGYKNIEDIDLEDKLYTHLGNWRVVDTIFKRNYNGIIYKIKASHSPYEIIATPEHPFLVQSENWIEAKNLNTEHKLGIKINTNNYVSKLLDDETSWLFLGYYLMNGWILKSNNLYEIYINTYDDEIVRIFNELNMDNYIDILFEFGIDIDKKQIPSWVHDAPPKYIKNFITGFYHVQTRNIDISMSYELQRLFLKINKTYKIEKIGNCHGFNLQNIEIKNDIAWYPIESITEIETKNEIVYNFNLTDHTYMAENIITHNCYGFQWRHFGAEYKDCYTNYKDQGIDQLQQVIDMIKKDPYSRRLLITAWNPLQLKEMVLSPCHSLFQFNVEPKSDDPEMKPYYLSCMLYQRSADMPLGVPFNIASYATLTHIIADLTELVAKELIYTTGDTHIYDDQLYLVAGQILREPYDFPEFEFEYDKKPEKIDEYNWTNMKIKNYKYHALIQYPFSC